MPRRTTGDTAFQFILLTQKVGTQWGKSSVHRYSVSSPKISPVSSAHPPSAKKANGTRGSTCGSQLAPATTSHADGKAPWELGGGLPAPLRSPLPIPCCCMVAHVHAYDWGLGTTPVVRKHGWATPSGREGKPCTVFHLSDHRYRTVTHEIEHRRRTSNRRVAAWPRGRRTSPLVKDSSPWSDGRRALAFFGVAGGSARVPHCECKHSKALQP